MITIHQNNFVPYSSIKNFSNTSVFYKKLFTPVMIESGNLLSLIVGLAHLTGKIYTPEPSEFGSVVCIFLQDETIVVKNRKTGLKNEIVGNLGDVCVFGSLFTEEWKIYKCKICLFLTEKNPLSYIYLSINHRLKYGAEIKKELGRTNELPIWKQCIQDQIDSGVMIGKGSYGNVYKANINGNAFAIKLSKLKEDALKNPFGRDSSSWFEVHFLRQVLKPLIQKNICPNLPLIYDAFACDNCKLNINDESVQTPCVITAIELASGNLKQYVRDSKPSTSELYSCIFQIMASLHTIQSYGQIMNYDVKKENILYYNVEAGGYWQYRIHGIDFYVPNFGKLFILNDFGISRSMSPKFILYKNKTEKFFKLGSRYAIVKNGKFEPMNATSNGHSEMVKWDDGTESKGCEFSLAKETEKVTRNRADIDVEYLKTKGCSINSMTKKFFECPEVIPPFEFYNDTQDAIRMFIGGKRSTQRGTHRKYPCVTNELDSQLRKYNGVGESSKDRIFSKNPAQLLAGYFLVDFFTENTNYRTMPSTNKLSTHIIS